MQKVKRSLVSVLAFSFSMALVVPASAESFSFTSSGEATGGVSVTMGNGSLVTAGSSKGTTTWTWASGGKVETTYVCYVMSQRPGEMFNLHGLCDVSEGDEVTSSVIFGCNYLNEERTESNCVGGLAGKSGKYAGKTGTISWHGGEDSSVGAGHWND